MKNLIVSITVFAFAALMGVGTFLSNAGSAQADDPQSIVPLAAQYGFVGTEFYNTSPDVPSVNGGDDIAWEVVFRSAPSVVSQTEAGSLAVGTPLGVRGVVAEDAIGPYVGTSPDLPIPGSRYDVASELTAIASANKEASSLDIINTVEVVVFPNTSPDMPQID